MSGQEVGTDIGHQQDGGSATISSDRHKEDKKRHTGKKHGRWRLRGSSVFVVVLRIFFLVDQNELGVYLVGFI